MSTHATLHTHTTEQNGAKWYNAQLKMYIFRSLCAHAAPLTIFRQPSTRIQMKILDANAAEWPPAQHSTLYALIHTHTHIHAKKPHNIGMNKEQQWPSYGLFLRYIKFDRSECVCLLLCSLPVYSNRVPHLDISWPVFKHLQPLARFLHTHSCTIMFERIVYYLYMRTRRRFIPLECVVDLCPGQHKNIASARLNCL